MKQILLISLLFFGALLNAQVGINTATPVNRLDINGDLNVRKEIRIGASAATKGSSGPKGTLFHNNANLNVNDWKDVKVADGMGSMSLFSMTTVFDKVGARFSGDNGSTSPYAEDLDYNTNWTVLTGTVSKFSITNAINKVTFTFQTTAQKTINPNSNTTNANASISFACGIFVDDKLKAVRTDVVLGGDGTNKIFNLNATLTNLPQKKDYNVKAACVKRNLNSGTLGIGRAVNTTFLNADMSQSVLTTSVLQPF